MRTFKLAAVASTALVGSLLAATGAFAQSTGTNEVEEVEIVATAGQPTIDGVITAETAPKAKASIDQEFISTQAAGQTVIQSLNLTPGLNFTNSDPYGSSGGNLRIRGFDGNRISLTFDGIPLNDTGNYAIYTNQQLDPELVARASVNMGTTDVDSPTASATGGTINYISLRPRSEFGGRVSGSVGEFNYGRIFGMIDTGEIGPMGTAAYVGGSYQKYDKFKGPGELEKWQVNGKIYQPIGDNGDFVSLAVHYNENRNAFYRTATIATFKTNGMDFDNNPTYLPLTTTNPGDFDTDPSANSDYYGLRINPSNTGNIRAQSKFSLVPDRLTLTVDSAVQYTLANGGGTTVLPERIDLPGINNLDRNLARLATGDLNSFDLNGDGDVNDRIRYYTPNTTNTRRYTTLASLIWNINDTNTLRVAYTYDYGDHRQTGHYGFLSANGTPQDVFGGKDGNGRKVFNAEDYAIRTRDRQSFAILNQFSLEYRGEFLDENLVVNVGLRAPFFKRELNQFCYTARGSSNVRCTSQTPTAVAGSANLVTFADVRVSNTNNALQQFVRPFEADVEYEDVLPNVGVSWQFIEGHTVFASYAEGLSAPRTDNLYTAGVNAADEIVLTDVEPETSKAWDLGYRYRSPTIIFSSALWYNSFENRIVSSFDPDLGFNVDRNVGEVKLWGVDAQAGWTPNEKFSLYGSLSYTHSELQDNVQLGATTELPTKGMALVETPEWMAAFRAQYNISERLSVAVQGKHVGNRFTTDVNDEETPAYQVFDADLRYDLPWFGDKGSYIQLNVTNLFDEEYFANISSGTNNKAVDVDPGPGVTIRNPFTAFVSVGAPRTIQATLNIRF
ncbi:MAG TPA: TonB-dependent receptor [Caulobacter sp.]|nr:TonB-dependent receptor [Caulobacter sp.]